MFNRKPKLNEVIDMTDVRLEIMRDMESDLEIHTSCGSPEFVSHHRMESIARCRDDFRASALRDAIAAAKK